MTRRSNPPGPERSRRPAAAVRTAKRRLAEADRRLFRGIERAHRPSLDRALVALSRAADHGVLWLGTSALLAAAGGSRGRRSAARGLVALGVTSTIVNVPAKRLLQRTRPVGNSAAVADPLLRIPASSSFPSGHAASAFAYATGAALEVHSLTLCLGILATAVGFSRVYVGVHYPADVAAGAAIGLAIALASAVVVPPAR